MEKFLHQEHLIESARSPEQIFEELRNNSEEMEVLEDRNFKEYAERVKKLRIKIEDPANPKVKARFVDEFGAKKVERDLTLARRLEEKFAQQRLDLKTTRGKGPLPVIAEGMVATDFYGNDWFGKAEEEVFVTPASLYDDFINKTDFIFELVSPTGKQEEAPSFIAALDVTIISPEDDSREGTTLERKFDDLKKLIENEHLGKFDYYESPRTGKLHHPEEGVPHVILMIPRKDLQDLLVYVRLKDEHPNNHALVDYCFEQIDNHPLRNDICAQIYQFVYRSMLYARVLEKRAQEHQGENIEALQSILGRLEEMGYPTEIADKNINARMERYFSKSALEKNLHESDGNKT